MAHSEDMIPMQMAKELAKAHAADLRRLAATPSPRLTGSRHFGRRPVLQHLILGTFGWPALRRAAATVRHPHLVAYSGKRGATCAP